MTTLLDLYCSDLAQHITTAAYGLDDLDRDLSSFTMCVEGLTAETRLESSSHPMPFFWNPICVFTIVYQGTVLRQGGHFSFPVFLAVQTHSAS